MCLGLARRDRDEAEHGRETGRIVMTPEGGYQEIREPVRVMAGARRELGGSSGDGS
jgi:ubiquinol-cytochrome c reductase cytochrome b subunit